MHVPGHGADRADESLRASASETASLGLGRGLVAALAALPVYLASYPPLYDYYHWLFQGYLVASLFPGSPAARPELAAFYYLRWVPVPNLAASLGIGLLSTVMSPATAGRLFLLACVLSFCAAYFLLVRTAQRRPSALELFAVPWAYGYLTYKGYLSSLLAVALAFAAIAFLHRATEREDRGVSRGTQAALAGLGVACYLLHLVGWLVFVAAVATYALWLAWRGRLGDGRRVVESTLPTLLLLGWYAWDRAGGVGLEFYSNVFDKAMSLYEGLLLFMRTDPVPAPFPLFAANVLGGLALLGVLWVNVDFRRRTELPLLATGVLVAGVAVLLPLYDMGDMGRPDERFLLPGILLVVAGLRHRVISARRAALAVLVVGSVLGAHALEYSRASTFLARIEATTEASIPPGTKVASYTVWGSRTDGACVSAGAPSIGTSSLKWFGLQREIVTHGTGSRLMETSLVHSRLGRYGAHELLVEQIDPHPSVVVIPRPVEVVELFGCDDEVDEAAHSLAPGFQAIEAGPGYAVLRRTPAASNAKAPSGQGQTAARSAPEESAPKLPAKGVSARLR